MELFLFFNTCFFNEGGRKGFDAKKIRFDATETIKLVLTLETDCLKAGKETCESGEC
jgi:hypothetical protein